MAGFVQLVVVYVVGGLTFVPLVLLAIFAHSYYSLPRTSPNQASSALETNATLEGDQDLKEKLLERNHDTDVAAGYFAVCREYVPGGVNGKPPERTTPAGETIATESPSVYQSMYRSIFERNKSQIPSLESGKAVKKARNVFYVVLRHGHLLLFDNSEQLEVRHVISLALYNLDIFAGGDKILEGELFIKRNCIRLSNKHSSAEDASRNMPFYLFSDNCSEKEDFYHAIILSQIHNSSNQDEDSPVTQMFDTEDMIKLVRALHLTDDLSQARWLNALAGRLFLGIYKTQFLEDFVRKRIEKKIARVPKPTFITSISLEHIDMGTSAPTLSNARLKEVTVDGSLTLEADIKYSGCIKVVIGAVAKIELGSRFKPRTVTLVLATILKRLEGHVLVRVKPPPSNRIWVSFETMPKMEVSVEPVVSSRQITYGIILRAIESRIREVMAETLVSPNADDFPFFDTQHQACRGGIWQRKRQPNVDTALADLVEKHEEEDGVEGLIPNSLQDELHSPIANKDKVPLKPSMSPDPLVDIQDAHVAVEGSDRRGSDSASLPPSHVSSPPKLMRSNSFKSAATPIVTKNEPVLSDGSKTQTKAQHKDATRTMKDLSLRSQASQEPSQAPSPSSSTRSSLASRFTKSSVDDSVASDHDYVAQNTPSHLNMSEEFKSDDFHDVDRRGSHDSHSQLTPDHIPARPSSPGHPKTTAAERKAALNQSIHTATTAATIAAKKWGMGVLARQQDRMKPVTTQSTSPGEPYGRGQPLPPIGQPLPRPASNWSTTALNPLLKRKPASPAPPLAPGFGSTTVPQLPPRGAAPPPKLPPRKAGGPQLPPRAGMEDSVTVGDEFEALRPRASTGGTIDHLDVDIPTGDLDFEARDDTTRPPLYHTRSADSDNVLQDTTASTPAIPYATSSPASAADILAEGYPEEQAAQVEARVRDAKVAHAGMASIGDTAELGHVDDTEDSAWLVEDDLDHGNLHYENSRASAS